MKNNNKTVRALLLCYIYARLPATWCDTKEGWGEIVKLAEAFCDWKSFFFTKKKIWIVKSRARAAGHKTAAKKNGAIRKTLQSQDISEDAYKKALSTCEDMFIKREKTFAQQETEFAVRHADLLGYFLPTDLNMLLDKNTNQGRLLHLHRVRMGPRIDETAKTQWEHGYVNPRQQRIGFVLPESKADKKKKGIFMSQRYTENESFREYSLFHHLVNEGLLKMKNKEKLTGFIYTELLEASQRTANNEPLDPFNDNQSSSIVRRYANELQKKVKEALTTHDTRYILTYYLDLDMHCS